MEVFWLSNMTKTLTKFYTKLVSPWTLMLLLVTELTWLELIWCHGLHFQTTKVFSKTCTLQKSSHQQYYRQTATQLLLPRPIQPLSVLSLWETFHPKTQTHMSFLLILCSRLFGHSTIQPSLKWVSTTIIKDRFQLRYLQVEGVFWEQRRLTQSSRFTEFSCGFAGQ